MDAITSDVRSLYRRLAESDIGVLGSFCDRATVDSPLGGRQLPPEFVAETRAWLSRHNVRCEDAHTTEIPGRIVHEITLWLTIDEDERELPVMLVADIAGGCIRDVRIYHSTWPLTGRHEIRHAVLPSYALAEEPAEPIGTYCRAFAAGDAAMANSVFEPDASVREPSGSSYVHVGADRSAWYERIFASGGIQLHLGSIADDGATVVCEYLVDWREGERLIPQAGAAAYTRGPNGKLVSARIYDDVIPRIAVSE